MSKKLELLIVLLTLSFWPLNLFFANTPGDFLRYIIPTLFTICSFVLFRANSSFAAVPLLAIPFVEPKLAALPFFAILFLWLWSIKEKKYLLFLVAALFALLVNWKPFWGQTIFTPDYEAQQEVIGKTYLYDSIFLARLFHNKPRIYINKFNNNFFALVDPNNYFFNFHPREILIDNQNLVKYPFLSIIFMLFGLYYIRSNPYFRFILIFLFGAILSLSILTVFDRNDFILWLPLSLVLIHGIKTFKEKLKKKALIFFVIFFVFSIPQLLRILIQAL